MHHRACLRTERSRRPRCVGRILVAVPDDAEHRAALHVGIRKAAAGQRQDQPAALLVPIEPNVCRPSRAGIDEEYAGGLEPAPRAVAVNKAAIRAFGLAWPLSDRTR